MPCPNPNRSHSLPIEVEIRAEEAPVSSFTEALALLARYYAENDTFTSTADVQEDSIQHRGEAQCARLPQPKPTR